MYTHGGNSLLLLQCRCHFGAVDKPNGRIARSPSAIAVPIRLSGSVSLRRTPPKTLSSGVPCPFAHGSCTCSGTWAGSFFGIASEQSPSGDPATIPLPGTSCAADCREAPTRRGQPMAGRRDTLPELLYPDCFSDGRPSTLTILDEGVERQLFLGAIFPVMDPMNSTVARPRALADGTDAEVLWAMDPPTLNQ